jgi:hypothetical protein
MGVSAAFAIVALFVAFAAPVATAQQAPATPVDPMSAAVQKWAPLLGAAVWGPEHQRLGEVEDVLVQFDGSVRVVTGIGGFLGIGERRIAVEADRVTVLADGSLQLALTKSELEARPEYPRGVVGDYFVSLRSLLDHQQRQASWEYPSDVRAQMGRPPSPATVPGESLASSAEKPSSDAGAPSATKALLEAQIAAIAPGKILFNPSPQMRVGDTETIVIRIGRNEIEDAIKTNLAGRGVPRIESIEVADFMSVRLSGGSAFRIETRSPEAQAIPSGRFAEWLFEVTPEEDGRQFLQLVVLLRFKLAEGEEVTSLPALRREIEVEVNRWWQAKQLMLAEWKWFVGGILSTAVLVVGYFGRRYVELGRKPASEAAQAPAAPPPAPPAAAERSVAPQARRAPPERRRRFGRVLR